MSSLFSFSTLTRDTETRMIVPIKEVVLGGMIAGALEQMHKLARDRGSNSWADVAGGLTYSLTGGMLTLGVTEIAVRGKVVRPKTKGLGTVGEILHAMGSENERIAIEFVTERFPGALQNVLRNIIRHALEQNVVIYVIDQMLAVVPTLVNSYTLEVRGKHKIIILGSIELEVLPLPKINLSTTLLSGALISIASSTVSNLLTAVPQEFKWVGRFVKEKKNS
jgi:hypothetical protein